MRMVDTMEMDYDTLQRAKMDAEQHQNTRIDFISQLPLDIVITTLIPLFLDGDKPLNSLEFPYLHVSKIWRERIVKCFGGLYFETGDGDDGNLPQVVQLARHIKTFDVERYSKGTWLGDLQRNHDFCSLQELDIYSKLLYSLDNLVVINFFFYKISRPSESNTILHR